MLQKTFEISSVKEANDVVAALKKIPEAATAGAGLLQVFVFGFSYEEATDIIKPIRKAFPGMLVIGLTLLMACPPEDGKGSETFVFDGTPVLRLGFSFFETSSLRLISFDLEEQERDSVISFVRKEMSASKYLRGVCIIASGFMTNISGMLEELTEGFEAIPFFGTLADVPHTNDRKTEAFFFDGEKAYSNGLCFVLYEGKELAIDAQYVFGWKPVGKPMKVTISENVPEGGDTALAEIDGELPEKIYKKYLGIDLDEYFSYNCFEFPLVLVRDGMLVGRIPLWADESGEPVFAGSIRKNDRVRFSYAVMSDLISDTERQSREFLEFSPQAIQLFVCANRSMLLKQDSVLEIEYYRRLAPDLLHCSAAGEIYYHHGKGEFLNGALVAVAFREGQAKEQKLKDIDTAPSFEKKNGIVPLPERILRFLQAMSGDLQDYANAARMAAKSRSAFLANMSHEIRTPINTVLGFNEMILRESDEEATLSYAADIKNAGNTLLSLIDDLLDLSRIEDGRTKIIPTQYDLASMINDLVNMTSELTETKGLGFRISVDPHIPRLLYGDEIHLKHIVFNILTNAVKYTESGEIGLDVSFRQTEPGFILLSYKISDTGTGMAPEELEKLLTPFSQPDADKLRPMEGTRLGISIVRQLLALMGSKLEVRSEKDHGTEFEFEVKQEMISNEPVGDLVPGTDKTAGGLAGYRELFHAKGARILVIDDIDLNLDVVKNLLKKTGIRIDTAMSGKAGIAAAKKIHYDVIFIDHMMPEMDGIETFHLMKEQQAADDGTVYIALTANTISGAREMYLSEGFSDYLSKPIDGRHLEEMLIKYLPKDKVVLDYGTSEPVLPERTVSGEQKILIIDDEEVVCRTAEGVLGEFYDVISCQDGNETVRMAKKEQPALILLDINLIGVDGFEVLARLKKDPAVKNIPVMFITADEDREKEVLGLKSGALDFIRKPFLPGILLERCKRTIALDRYRKDLQGEVHRQALRAERITEEMMVALSQSVDAKDHYTNGHSERVAAYAAEIGRRMGKSPEEQKKLYEVGLLHDVGKIGIPEEIINKKGKLTDEEFTTIKGHTCIGYEILNGISDMPELSAGARSHHERYDGHGYPDGLAGEKIPEIARIICVADCYDAMTSTRTYSAPKTQQQVRDEIIRCKGTHFDPDIADVMIAMIDDDKKFLMNERTGGRAIWKTSAEIWGAHQEAAAPKGRKTKSKKKATASLPKWLYEVPDLDVSVGILNCGSEETYLSVLSTFHRSAKVKADEIERFFKAGDIKDYTIKVHALKSSAQIIGALTLSDAARVLENAGKTGETGKISKDTGDLLKMYLELDEYLSKLDAE